MEYLGGLHDGWVRLLVGSGVISEIGNLVRHVNGASLNIRYKVLLAVTTVNFNVVESSNTPIFQSLQLDTKVKHNSKGFLFQLR